MLGVATGTGSNVGLFYCELIELLFALLSVKVDNRGVVVRTLAKNGPASCSELPQ